MGSSVKLKKLFRDLPPIAWRDERLNVQRQHINDLRAEVRRLGGTIPAQPAAGTAEVSGSTGQHTRRVSASSLFDAEWYREQYELPADANPARHYVTDGYREGNSPHPLFHELWYRQGAGAKGRAAGPALLHYLDRGRSGAVSPHPTFPQERYLERHPDSAEHPDGPLGHYLAAAGGGLPGLPDPAELRRRAVRVQEEIRATRGYEHLERMRPTFDVAAEQEFLSRMSGHTTEGPLVSVVLPTKDRVRTLPGAIDSVLAQTYQNWELLVVDDGSRDGTDELLRRYAEDPRVKVLRNEQATGVAAARNKALRAAQGELVAYLDSDNTWVPHFLGTMVAFLGSTGDRAGYACSALIERGGQERRSYRAMPFHREALKERNYIDCIVVVHERALLDEVGTFDESLRRNVDWDLLIRLADATDFGFAPFIATEYDLWEEGTDRISTDEPESYRYLVRQRTLVDWEQVAGADRDAELLSVVVGATKSSSAVIETVERVLAVAARPTEVVVVDSRLPEGQAVELLSRFGTEDRVQVRRLPQALPLEVARNVGAAMARGGKLAFLHEHSWCEEGWDAALVAALDDVPVVQPLVLRRSGEVWSAGTAIGPREVPVATYAGFPGTAPEVRGRRPVAAAEALCLAARADAFAAAEGFDPLYVRHHTGVATSLRITGGRPDGALCVGDSVVTLQTEPSTEPKGHGQTLAVDNESREQALLRSLPGLEDPAAGMAGYRLVGLRRTSENDIAPSPLIVHDRPRRPLRWAIKIGTPTVAERHAWGDWHFASALRDELEELGHKVAIDCRQSWYRPTAALDDVALVLQGRGRYRPNPGQVTMNWIISHPADVTLAELDAFDRVLVASETWAARAGRRLRRRPEALLQCTDARRFRPVEPDPDLRHDVVMVGNARGPRPAVAAALDQGIVPTVYGAKWAGLLPEGAWRGMYFPNERLPVLYRSAGVVLNDHWPDMVEHAFISNRLFDLLACEANVVSDHVEGMDEVFGDAVRTFAEPAELKQHVTEILADPEGHRASLREAGRRVREQHTFAARAQTLAEHAAVLVGQRP
ncbi:glycosyltransferase [Georgenia sp. 10Sc9-8]|uniref:Glycosyltransferase n=1 Tax=Georgenia halotolerans TaxID=3028317 RepID=A0ABT5TXR0_9MICO|nr:glycosyltransferase [Georgenia halotolerans]